MKFHWLILSFCSVFLGCSPAEAAKLLSWRFDTNQNQLTIRTDAGVQPVVKLIQNPTRLVIDLPGTIADLSQLEQMVGGAIKSVRVGQFEADIARLVVELAPGYTLNPEEVKIRGLSSTQWIVNLPEPDRLSEISTKESEVPVNQPPNIESRDFQVTKNGLFIRYERREGNKISVRRSEDRRQIEIDLAGVTLPADLLSSAIALNEYGISEVEFSQTSTSARLVLNVTEDSPDWLASYSRIGDGGLVLLPKNKLSSRATNRYSQTENIPTTTSSATSQETRTIESVTLAANGSELMVNSDQKVKAKGSWQANGVYEIRIDNAKLASDFSSPGVTTNSTLSRLRVWQESADTVVILVHPALGVHLNGEIKQPSDQVLVLQLRELTAVNRTLYRPKTPPLRDESVPLARAWERVNSNRTPQEKLVVIIDPGHGGKDPGAIGIGGVKEKELIFPMAQQVADILEKQGIQVIMTRKSDYYVGLEDRAKMANQAGADLFISIHANSMGMSRPDINGLETYYFQDGIRLAETIHNSILKRVDVDNRGIRRARFFVLRETQMPAVLLEVGFLTGKEDAQKLSNPDYRSQISQAIAEGILQYVRNQRL
ncbi:N-acetylmuramoyl-L-alanine amidase [Gloeocapsa sp. PCC 73106]|uniref:N-acetylmuramoyl-L-alanine amidase n=1 Tax=Gloeocapsa sp. PCC 73106 TaxID=102232 RepID=UPI0002ABEFD0|nr:N-acetylmuramoyl-L-alanine amidase [Gloeocapsa sp. PCC 73106]ELR97520.1 N-acetylmuramoyl-L-alanine amidase [Gloeocapsa sp. PCC 73106]